MGSADCTGPSSAALKGLFFEFLNFVNFDLALENFMEVGKVFKT